MSASEDDPTLAFHSAMAEHGLATKQKLIADGKLHRFHVEGDQKGSSNGYYTLHLDGRPAGVFGCWRRDIKETWRANGQALSDFDYTAFAKQIAAARGMGTRASGPAQSRRRECYGPMEQLPARAGRAPVSTAQAGTAARRPDRRTGQPCNPGAGRRRQHPVAADDR